MYEMYKTCKICKKKTNSYFVFINLYLHKDVHVSKC